MQASLAPAQLARRHRRQRLLLFVPIVLAVALAFFVLQKVYHRIPQGGALGVAIVAIIATCSLGFWGFSVRCPRCGWNVNLRKSTMPQLAAVVPSVCPNCGLDLESPPDSKVTCSG